MAKRKPNPMPGDVREILDARDVMEDYRARPFYQRNDYLGWIERAKKPATRQKRIDQMVEELEIGGIYMGMKHRPSRKDGSRS